MILWSKYDGVLVSQASNVRATTLSSVFNIVITSAFENKKEDIKSSKINVSFFII